jgi:AcrR family transcriptional regulator
VVFWVTGNERKGLRPPHQGFLPLLGYATRVAERVLTGEAARVGAGDDSVTRGAERRVKSATSPGGQRGRRRLSVDERRDELIAAALDLFSARPPDEVSIDDVAAAAGASRALVYHYFGGKHELYVAALRSAAKQLSDLLEPPAEGRPLERLRISVRRYFDFAESHAAGFTALLRGGPADRSGEVGEIIEGVRQLLLVRIAHALSVDSPGPVLRITLRSWMAAVETAAMDWLEHRDLARADLEHLLVGHQVVMLQVAGRHDPEVAALLARADHLDPLDPLDRDQIG